MRAFDRGGERDVVGALQRRQLALDGFDFAAELGDALAVVARGGLELVALRGKGGQRGGEVGEDLFRRVQLAIGLDDARIDAAALAGVLARFGADGFFLGGKPGERRFGVGGELLFALDVGGELHEPHVKLGDAVLGARFLAVEVLLRDGEPVQRGAGAGFRLAQFGQRCGGERLAF